MPANFTKPVTSDLRADVLSYIRDYQTAQAKMFAGETLTSTPTDAIRYNSGTTDFERWNGSAWAQLPTLFARTAAANTFTAAQAFTSATFSGSVSAQAGGKSLELRPGSADYTYIGLNARTSSPTTESGWIGYGSAAATTLTVRNTLAGNLDLYNTAAARLILGSDGITRHYGDFRTRGQGRFTGWYGSPSGDEQGLAAEVGTSGGAAYLQAYNRNSSAYGVLNIDASIINLSLSGTAAITLASGVAQFRADVWHKSASDGANRFNYTNAGRSHFGSQNGYEWRSAADSVLLTLQNDGYLLMTGWHRLPNASGLYTAANDYLHPDGASYWEMRSPSGMKLLDRGATLRGYVYHDSNAFGLLGSAGSWAVRIPHGASYVQFPANVRADVLSGYTDTNKWLAMNEGTLTYGGQIVTGVRNGYHGIAVYDASRNPTLMSNGSSSGIYNQGLSYWDYYNDGTYFRIGRTPFVEGQNGILYYASGSGGANAKITVSTSPPSGTPADGEIWIQREA